MTTEEILKKFPWITPITSLNTYPAIAEKLFKKMIDPPKHKLTVIDGEKK